MMKFMLVVFVIAIVLFNVRSGIAARRRRSQERAPGPAAPQSMLSCAQCGVHLPLDESLPGRGGVFCSAAHRTAYEREHPTR